MGMHVIMSARLLRNVAIFQVSISKRDGGPRRQYLLQQYKCIYASNIRYEVGLLCLLFVARIIGENLSTFRRFLTFLKLGSVTGSIDILFLAPTGKK